MHIVITDSGVGGLSVIAYVERFLRSYSIGEPVRLTFVNASPADDYGYNAMGSREEKLETFERFLRNVYERYSPDMVYVACNTLSVLLHDTPFAKSGNVPVKGIVETGGDLLLGELKRDLKTVATIFATVTTIGEGTYSKFLRSSGIPGDRIIPQACPTLADTISSDRQGVQVMEEIREYTAEAIDKSQVEDARHLAYMGCTHYGYRQSYFARAFEEQGADFLVLDPNELAVDDIFGDYHREPRGMPGESDVEIEFVTRYKISESVLETVTFFLEEISPNTVRAFQDYTHAPDLF